MVNQFFFQSLAAFGRYTTFTPTGTWTTNTTYSGAWFRLGENMFINYRVTLAGAPDNTSLFVNLPLVNGATVMIDSGKLVMSANAARTAVLGAGIINDANAGVYAAQISYGTTFSLLAGVFAMSTGVTYLSRAQIGATTPAVFASGDDITLHAVVPIFGWNI